VIEWHQFSSVALKGFPVGDPHERRFPVYLPPNYSATRSEPYPVVFLLSGWGAKSSHYLAEDSAFDLPLQTRWDQSIASGKLKPFIAVFPDGTSKLGCGQYVNSTAIGNHQDYLCDELVDWVDGKFHTHRDSNFRIVAGHSSGGFGALVAGMMRPDVFKFVCCSAGDSFYEVSLLPNLSKAIIEIEKAGGLEGFLKKFRAEPSSRNIAIGQIETMLTLNMCACYAPNPRKPPLYADLFFDLSTGEVVKEVWDRILAWDPLRMIDRYAEGLKSLKWVQLECGLQDQHGLQLGHRQLSRAFHARGIPHELVEYPGSHSGHHWRFADRLIRIFERMYGSGSPS